MDTPDSLVSFLARSKLARAVGAGAASILVSFVPEFEGTIFHTYYDPVRIKTACVGHTGPELRLGQTFTKEECDEMLNADLVHTANGIRDCIDVPLSTNQTAAFVSFAFNVGVDAFCKSTLARTLNEGDYAGACAQLSRWVYSGGQRLPGLERRRAAERAMCEEGDDGAIRG